MFRPIWRAALFVVLVGISSRAQAAAPAALTVAASGLTSSSAVLNGSGTPNGEATTGRFRYSPTNPGICNDTFGTRVPAASGTDLGAGSASVPYSITTTGLTPGVTYYFCSIVSNATGTAFGAILNFTIPSTPVVTTVGSTSVTSNTATLSGTANPVAAATTAWFRYSQTNPVTCDDSFGLRAPSSGATNIGSGIVALPYSQPITGLSPGVTYYYCAIANNSYGTSVGAVLSFTTPANAPTVTTSGATNLTRTTGTLTGYANPGGDATTGWFRYSTGSPGTCNDTFGNRAPATGGTALGSGTMSSPFSQAITALAPATTYYYCAIAANSIATSWGAVQMFTTPSTPTATTTAATNITNSSATLNGSGNPSRANATGWFRYSLTNPGTCDDKFGSRSPVTGGTALGSDIYDQPYSQSISGLSPATTYYYCAIVSSSEGTALGAVLTFDTSTQPATITNAASAITATSATLNGAADPNGATALGWFRYSNTNPGSCNDSFGSRAPSSSGTGLGAGTANVNFAYPVSSLAPGTTYYFCAISSNSYGTSFGALLTFVTPTTAPTVTTSSATNLTRTTGTLTGYANPGGDATTGWFRYSLTSPGTCNDTFGTRAPTTGGSALGAGTSSAAFSQNITALAPATTYYYCALASNSAGTVWGSVLTFVTPSAPTALTTVATSITTSSATLNGSGNPNRSASTGWFRYSATNPGTCDDKFGSRSPISGGTALGSDIYDQPYSQSISGLSSGATYYYCAIVSSAEGTAFGAVLSFTTSGAPTATTNAASSITATSASLNGAGNPNGATAVGWFRYSTTSPGTCNDSFGTRAPSSSGTSLGAGTANVNFTYPISGLAAGSTYYFCAISSNSYGTGFGAVLTFITPTTAPVVTTSSAINLTRTTGTLTGYANPGGDATTGWFRYSAASPGTCNDTFGTRAPTTGGSALGAGTSSASFSQNITGLTAATTYYYCAIASNSSGTVWGSVLTFISPSVPTALTTVATNITTSSATLNGSGNPNRTAATGWFRYSTTNPGTCDDKFGSRSPTSGGTALGSDIYDQPYSQSISGLSSGTTYYYCAIVASTEGTAFGAVLSVTTSGAPTATTNAASSITATSASLNGAGNPNGATATGWFRYSTTSPGTCNDSFGTRAPSSSGTSLGAGTTNVNFAYPISGLLPGSTYYFCAISSNSYGTGFGSVLSFTTPTTGPTVTTSSATNLTRTTGTLTGYGNPGGDATTGWFRFSTSSPGTCNDTFGTRAPTTGGSALGAGTSSASFSQNITGLAPATTYYYCALASNSSGTVWGSVLTFITPSSPTALTTAATNVTNTSAYLNGSGNPNRAAASGWFRYSTTNPGTCDDKFGSRSPTSGGTALGSDIYDQPYSQSISGLSPATTYYYCAIVSSTEGTAFGAVLPFITSAAATATTNAATSITATGAILNGAGNPFGATTTAWFRYSNTNPGSCNDSFGSRMPSSSGTGLGAGTTPVTYAYAIAGLLPGSTYYFCAIDSNSYGTGFGAVLSFTTPTTAPVVTTSSAINLTRTTGTLTGYANPGGDATTGWFRYSTASPGTCNDTFGTRAPTTGGSALGAVTSSVAFSQAITGLAPATPYYYCAIASNSSGTVWGSVLTFITPSSPTALTTPATNITTNSASLNGSGNPNRAATTGWFRYSTTNPGVCNDAFGSRAPTSGGTSLGSDIFDQPYTQSVSGLSPATTYYYCAIVSSTEGTALGAILSFTTSAPAATTTTAATSVTSTTATLNGSGNPNGAAATGWFRYSNTSPGTCNDTFGTRMPSSGGVSLGAGSTSTTFSQAITGLAPGVTYYFCALASNAYGTGMGAVLSFTTPASPPTVSTDLPTGTTITLNGSANPNGDFATGWFRIANTSPGTCNDTFGTRVPTASGTALGNGSSYVSYSNPAPALTPGATYYYCAIAANAVGTSFGIVRSFIAPMPPTVATLAATPVTATTATLNGSGNPNGNSTIAWFRYSTSSPGACNDVFGTRTPTSGGTSLGAGTTSTPFSQAISGLSAGTTYYFCAIASSAFGTSLGSVLSFTTPPTAVSPPTAPPAVKPPYGGWGSATLVNTTDASKVGPDSAALNGNATPNGTDTTGWFRYDIKDPGNCNDTFGTRAPLKDGTQLGAGFKAVDFSQTVKGLTLGTTYYFCAIAASSSGTVFGKVITLTTQAGQPIVTTMPPTDVGKDSAVLNANTVPNGAATTSWFRYDTIKPQSCTDNFGTRAPIEGGRELGAGVATVATSEAIFGLTADTTYYYCAIATNSLGTTYGEILTFVPGATPPTVNTDGASAIDPTSATIAGTVDPNGSDAKVWFRYGDFDPGLCDDSFGSRAGTSDTASGTQTGPSPADPTAGGWHYMQRSSTSRSFTAPLTGLKPRAIYYYCVAASNKGGAAFGKVLSFTTTAGSADPATAAGSADSATSAVSQAVGTESQTLQAAEPTPTGGCSYTGIATANARSSRSNLPLLAMLPLAGYLLLRRRRRTA